MPWRVGPHYNTFRSCLTTHVNIVTRIHESELKYIDYWPVREPRTMPAVFKCINKALDRYQSETRPILFGNDLYKWRTRLTLSCLGDDRFNQWADEKVIAELSMMRWQCTSTATGLNQKVIISVLEIDILRSGKFYHYLFICANELLKSCTNNYSWHKKTETELIIFYEQFIYMH